MHPDDPDRSAGDVRPDREPGGRRRADGTGRHQRPESPPRSAGAPDEPPPAGGRPAGRTPVPRSGGTGGGTGARPYDADGPQRGARRGAPGPYERDPAPGGPRPWAAGPGATAGRPPGTAPQPRRSGPAGHGRADRDAGARRRGGRDDTGGTYGHGAHDEETPTYRRSRAETGEYPAAAPEATGARIRDAAHGPPADRTRGTGLPDGGGRRVRGSASAAEDAGPDDDPGIAGTGPVTAGSAAAAGHRSAPPTGHGHGHGHGHGSPSPAGRRVRNLLVALLVPCALATLAGVALLWPGDVPTPEFPPTEQVRGDVTAVAVADCSPGSADGACTGVTIAMTDGPRAGRDLVQLVPNEPSSPRFAVGDPVTLAWSGGDPDSAGSYQLNDFQRTPALIWLAAAFALAVVLLGRLRGFAALISLGLTFGILLWFVLPAILSGGSPLAVAVTGACLIMFVVLYLTHGFSARTSCAVLGTLVSLALIGVIGYGFTAAARLTGLDDTTANLIGTLGGIPIDPRGLVLAGLVIGALGALDDVTVTQASAVWELGAANPELGARALFSAGMRIGRDHVASAVNTLVLAYAGAALPLMLLFSVAAGGVSDVLTGQDVATEIVRTLAGSIGLVAAVPVTTGLAALVAAHR
ncbi:YibE/F family protein [Pseudonocardia sp. NPDC046786]|uniref:YibE/F family protein n=1 Tax=Pseudonocardia sp. NPDC046786 TaxID=3155471 RepID=UPI0033DFAFF9